MIRMYGVTSLDEFYGRDKSAEPVKVSAVDNARQITGAVLPFPAADKRESANASAAKRANALIRCFLSLDEQGRSVLEHVAAVEKRRCSAAGQVRELLVYDTPASAGTGNYLDGEGYSREAVDGVPDAADFGVRIQGDSMAPRLRDGDIAFIKATPNLQDGDIGLFVLNNESFCKRLRIDHDNQKVYLESINPKYGAITVNIDDSLRTVGKIIEQGDKP